MDNPVLYDYFDKKADALLVLSKLNTIQRSSINIGDNREIFLNKFLKQSLPNKLIVKEGEIWDQKGNKTDQLDTIIVRDDCPCLDFGGKDVFLIEGIFAVIEIKSNLDSRELNRAGETLERVKNLNISSRGVAIRSSVSLDRPLRIVFSYNGINWNRLRKLIVQNNWEDLFDLICILGKGVIFSKGRLVSWNTKHNLYLLENKSASLAFLYYYLVLYGSSVLVRNINITPYFEPLNSWRV
jgi:hypothetical protein